MIDADLAFLYGVETKQLKRQVKRNTERFPDDFMFELTREEYQYLLRCHFGALKRGAHSKYIPLVFTEQGVAMLSSVLNSKRAIMVNIQIMRAFVNFKREGLTCACLKRKLENIEKKYDVQFKAVFQAIRSLLNQPKEELQARIGFHP